MSNTYVILKQQKYKEQKDRQWWLVNLGGPKANGPVMSSSRWHAKTWKTRGAAERFLDRYLSFIACGDDPSSLSVIEFVDDEDQYHGSCAVCGERVDYGQDDHNRETNNHLYCDGIFD